jgi:hypothetical protein
LALVVLLIIRLVVRSRITFTDQLFLRVGLRPVVVSVAAILVVAILRSLVMDHLGLNLVLEYRNDLSAIVSLVDLLILIIWARLLLINLNDLLLLLDSGI